jgi:hypothetical protein
MVTNLCHIREVKQVRHMILNLLMMTKFTKYNCCKNTLNSTWNYFLHTLIPHPHFSFLCPFCTITYFPPAYRQKIPANAPELLCYPRIS